ncbi:Aspartyl/asparaginyl beta-hydroxylase (Aspartate beta-hydroxylase) (ASP beta-hydroxylase) (Peptide-aspartate beta-dioxygenase) [Durusdinium trenchii]|uniref:Aspartyl/asparaginyl beta-hydroxylase (Aspartate beta-hydroxylase) (ASP beta-hydroxylase) (Peptide-aspartate beta-dioxygenase) n=2 Tax=Symbiodiniaceae TaxID=252141 RepID=A0ABP0IVJ4_9DINO
MNSALDLLQQNDLATSCEAKAALGLLNSSHPFTDQLATAESIHIHVKVDDTTALPHDSIAAAGGQLDYEKEGFIKFKMPGGVNLIFSSIAVSQDDLAETECSRRARPFVDHFGIDLRSEADDVAALFQSIPCKAKDAGWALVSQGDSGGGVHCCHVEVKAKYWVYPTACSGSTIPLEFAFGELKVNPVSGGCDLRPMAPDKAAAMGGLHFVINAFARSLAPLVAFLLRPYAMLMRRCSNNRWRFDSREFAWTAKLEENIEAMRDEFLAVQAECVPNLKDVLTGNQQMASTGWRLLALRYWSFDVPSNCQLCPQTWELVRNIPDMTMATFSVLEGGEHIPAHRGVFPGLLRCHVPLLVPTPADSCRIRIGQESHSWQIGQSLVFDDSFEHEVWNDSDQPRIVLLIDIKRPLPQPLRAINNWLTRVACSLFVLGTTNWDELTVAPNPSSDIPAEEVAPAAVRSPALSR